MKAFLSNPAVQGAFAGFLAAVRVDYKAYQSWKSEKDFLAYDWGTAAWRWVQGAIGGALGGSGIAGLASLVG